MTTTHNGPWATVPETHRESALRAEADTGCTARYIRPAEPSSEDHVSRSYCDQVNPIGDQWRCQLGKRTTVSGIVKSRCPILGPIEQPWTDPDFFIVAGVGRTFEDAARMVLESRKRAREAVGSASLSVKPGGMA